MSSYNCNYVLKDSNQNHYGYNQSCFSSFYNYISNYIELEYYIPITDIGMGYTTKFDEELILKYNELLKQLGLKFEYLGKVTTHFKDYNTNLTEFEAFAYKIVFADNSILANKLLLNFLRYLYEYDYPTIVNNVFKLLELNLNECLFNIFILAHYHKSLQGGHDIRGSYFFKLFNTEQEYVEWLNKKRDDSSVYFIIPRLKNSYLNLHKVFNEDLNKFYKQYKQVIEDESKQEATI